MNFHASVDGVYAVDTALGALGNRIARGGLKVSYVVGYTAPYAVYVHEDLTKNHPNGQTKFLEQPARQNARTYAGIIVFTLAKTWSLTQALAAAGLRLLADSQKLVPVKTGFLKSTGFSKVE